MMKYSLILHVGDWIRSSGYSTQHSPPKNSARNFSPPARKIQCKGNW